jgi:hypothetical protein
MVQLIIFLVICISLSPIVYLWVRGIDFMQKNHPDYKGEDFLNWGNDKENEDDKNQIM